MSDAERNLDEQHRAARIEHDRIRNLYLRQPDENGISCAMIDKMLNVVAEGLTTGSTDLRSLLYCAYREARNIQKQQKDKT